MAGTADGLFREKLTPFLDAQLLRVEEESGRTSNAYHALERQYIRDAKEDRPEEGGRRRHYESEVHIEYDGMPLRGVERLYRRSILIEPSTVCAAHCRWCLRGQYPLFSLKKAEIANFARYCGSEEVRDDLREILITGGDPFMVPQRLEFIFQEVKKYAPNIEIFRIGTRVPVQDPSRVNAELLDVLSAAAPAKVEIAAHINHPVELGPEARAAIASLYDVVFKIYDQTVLLKGVNDEVDVLCELYDAFRSLGIEAHYLFHCIPMSGMSHHRTSIARGLDLIGRVTSSGAFSGRAKPMYTLLTDVGKVTLYDGVMLERNAENEVLIQTHYRVENFQRWNPSWRMPAAAFEDEDGLVRVWYPDARDGATEAVVRAPSATQTA